MLHNHSHDPLQNQQLASLSADVYLAVKSHLSVLSFPIGTTLMDDGGVFEDVYFPLAGMISLVVEMKDGTGIETATVGREGVVGAMSALGIPRSHVRATVQLPLVCARISARALSTLADKSKPIRDLCMRYNETLLVQARINAACNVLHQLDARFCRWILQTSDRIDGKDIALTQEFLGEMLGVRRTSVTDVAHKFKSAGMINYSRGHIKILDRDAMKLAACECYETLRNATREIAETKLAAHPRPTHRQIGGAFSLT
jgi:CRP-like cAMP-binding protein